MTSTFFADTNSRRPFEKSTKAQDLPCSKIEAD